RARRIQSMDMMLLRKTGEGHFLVLPQRVTSTRGKVKSQSALWIVGSKLTSLELREKTKELILTLAPQKFISEKLTAAKGHHAQDPEAENTEAGTMGDVACIAVLNMKKQPQEKNSPKKKIVTMEQEPQNFHSLWCAGWPSSQRKQLEESFQEEELLQDLKKEQGTRAGLAATAGPGSAGASCSRGRTKLQQGELGSHVQAMKKQQPTEGERGQHRGAS
ncbi:hypothetical protein J0S82_005129, partial [Galemys pyrenaicus]